MGLDRASGSVSILVEDALDPFSSGPLALPD